MCTWPVLNEVNKHKDSSYLCSERLDHFLCCFAFCSFFPSYCDCLFQLFSCPFKLNFLKLGFTSKIFHLRERDWSGIIMYKFFFFFIGKKQYIDQKKIKGAPKEYTRGIQKGNPTKKPSNSPIPQPCQKIHQRISVINTIQIFPRLQGT